MFRILVISERAARPFRRDVIVFVTQPLTGVTGYARCRAEWLAILILIPPVIFPVPAVLGN